MRKIMASIAIAQQIIRIIQNKCNLLQSSTTEFEDTEVYPNIQEIVEKIKELLPDCEILETYDDYIIINYQKRIVRCRC